ncbi:MAG: hypothetical protein LBU06_02140 [Desulfovibrio sp.]|nr:hypothetical protein [Desulfovibrio sp.]
MQSSPGGSLEFAFDPSAATVSRPENSNDLVFDVDGGGRAVISGFFEVGTYSLPNMVLPNGMVVTSADFIAVNNPDVDMTTAAGPTPRSDGLNEFAGDSGDLVGSVDRLGTLGTDYWDTVAEAADRAPGVGFAGASDYTGAVGGAPIPKVVYEGGQVKADVYLMIDASWRTNDVYMLDQVNAIKQMANKYLDLGIDATFTLIPYHLTGVVMLDSVDAGTLLKVLEPIGTEDKAYSFFNAHLSSMLSDAGKYYGGGLTRLIEELDKSRADPVTRDIPKTMFFLADGRPDDFDGKNTGMMTDYRDTWRDYLDRASADDWLDVYALGIGDAMTDVEARAHLLNIAGDASRIFSVKDYAGLGDVLAGLVPPVTGNLLSGWASGEILRITLEEQGNEVSYDFSVWDATLGLYKTAPIDLGDGVNLVVYRDGQFHVEHSSGLSEDKTLNVRLTLMDADGNVTETPGFELIIRDYKPVAGDNEDTSVEVAAGSYHVLGQWEEEDNDNGDRLLMECQFDGWSNYRAGVGISAPPFPDTVRAQVLADYGCDLAAVNRDGDQNTGLMVGMGIRGWAPDRHLAVIMQGNDLGKALDDLGIQSYVRSGSGVDAESGVHLAARSFESAGGEIIFNYTLHGSGLGGNRGAAIWMLMDKDGKIIASDIAYQFADGVPEADYSDYCRIPVPESGNLQHYTLVIGTVNGGDESTPSYIAVGAVVQLESGGYSCRGNLIHDPGPNGETDVAFDNAQVGSVTYDGVLYLFAAGETTLSIDTGYGRFLVDRNGGYSFHLDGNTGFPSGDFVYRLVDEDGDWSDEAVLRINAGVPIYGSAADDAITGGAGEDILYGEGGNDEIRGGAGDDTIRGGAGDDSIYGGDGRDVLYGGDGKDRIEGGAGDDAIYGEDGNDEILGGAGDDTIDGGAGDDAIYGEDGNDEIRSGAGYDTIHGGTGHDFLSGGDGNDSINGGDGNDRIRGDAGDDAIYGEDGSDHIQGDAGDDTIHGGAGYDLIYGGDGNDSINGGDDNDHIL